VPWEGRRHGDMQSLWFVSGLWGATVWRTGGYGLFKGLEGFRPLRRAVWLGSIGFLGTVSKGFSRSILIFVP
jgi:hypothetical protein